MVLGACWRGACRFCRRDVVEDDPLAENLMEYAADNSSSGHGQPQEPAADASKDDSKTEAAAEVTNAEPKDFSAKKANDEDVQPEDAVEHSKDAVGEDGKTEGVVERAAMQPTPSDDTNSKAVSNEVEREAAATRIQSVRRASVVRREHRAKADIKEESVAQEAVAQSAPSDGANVEAAGNGAEREAAATRIQSVRRGSLVRREQSAKSDAKEDKAEELIEKPAAQTAPSEEANGKRRQIEVTVQEAAAQPTPSDDVNTKDEKVKAAEDVAEDAEASSMKEEQAQSKTQGDAVNASGELDAVAQGEEDKTACLEATNAARTFRGVANDVPPANKSGDALKQSAAKGKKGKKGKKK